MALVRVRKVDDILRLSDEELHEHCVGVIAHQYGETVISDFLMLYMLELLEFLNLSDERKMGAKQIQQTAALILDDPCLRSLTLEDYKIFFNKIKRGGYGELYGRIDGQMILRWLYEYWDERSILFEEKSRAEAFSHNSASSMDRRIGAKQLNELAEQTMKHFGSKL